MKIEHVSRFPNTSMIKEFYWTEDGKLVGKYQSFYRNGKIKVEKDFDDNGERIRMLRYRPDGTKITKLGTIEQSPQEEVTLTYEELDNAIKVYTQVRKKALSILTSRGIKISLRSTDKSLLKQFKDFEENRFSF